MESFLGSQGCPDGRDGIYVYTRPLRYRNKTVKLPNGNEHTFLDGDEKGIDVRIALDVIRLANENAYDVALVFCRDQDFSEVAEELRAISKADNRWIKMASAFPYSPAHKVRGIDKTDWVRIERATYDKCLDGRDYRPKKP